MTTTIEGQPTSAEVRESLAAEGRPVLLAFSRGKDSIAAWLALRAAGVDVIPYHMYLVPDLAFVAALLRLDVFHVAALMASGWPDVRAIAARVAMNGRPYQRRVRRVKRT